MHELWLYRSQYTRLLLLCFLFQVAQDQLFYGGHTSVSLLVQPSQTSKNYFLHNIHHKNIILLDCSRKVPRKFSRPKFSCQHNNNFQHNISPENSGNFPYSVSSHYIFDFFSTARLITHRLGSKIAICQSCQHITHYQHNISPGNSGAHFLHLVSTHDNFYFLSLARLITHRVGSKIADCQRKSHPSILSYRLATHEPFNSLFTYSGIVFSLSTDLTTTHLFFISWTQLSYQTVPNTSQLYNDPTASPSGQHSQRQSKEFDSILQFCTSKIPAMDSTAMTYNCLDTVHTQIRPLQELIVQVPSRSILKSTFKNLLNDAMDTLERAGTLSHPCTLPKTLFDDYTSSKVLFNSITSSWDTLSEHRLYIIKLYLTAFPLTNTYECPEALAPSSDNMDVANDSPTTAKPLSSYALSISSSHCNTISTVSTFHTIPSASPLTPSQRLLSTITLVNNTSSITLPTTSTSTIIPREHDTDFLTYIGTVVQDHVSGQLQALTVHQVTQDVHVQQLRSDLASNTTFAVQTHRLSIEQAVLAKEEQFLRKQATYEDTLRRIQTLRRQRLSLGANKASEAQLLDQEITQEENTIVKLKVTLRKLYDTAMHSAREHGILLSEQDGTEQLDF